MTVSEFQIFLNAFFIFFNPCTWLLLLIMGLRLLHLVEPISRLFPSVIKPVRSINMKEKLLYTSITLFIYLVCCQIPIYGVLRAEGSDPFMWMRVILASNRGTLM
jgi:protein transport protein SEC61 subunit alpha